MLDRHGAQPSRPLAAEGCRVRAAFRGLRGKFDVLDEIESPRADVVVVAACALTRGRRERATPLERRITGKATVARWRTRRSILRIVLGRFADS